MRNKLRCVLILAAAFAFAVSATPSPAQTWPQRSVKFLVTLGPGSGIDIGTRLLADRLSKRWGQPVVVENRPGGDGLVAISAMIAAQDDHVLLASPTSSFTAHPFVYKNLPYKPDDLQPIARVSNTIIVMAAPPDLALDGLVGFFGPPEMPLPLRTRIAADVGEVGADPAIAARLNDTGQLPNFGGPAEFHAAIELQRARVAAAAKELGIVPTE